MDSSELFAKEIIERIFFTILLMLFVCSIQIMVPIPGITQTYTTTFGSMILRSVYIKDEIILPTNILILGISPFITSHIFVYSCVKISEMGEEFKSAIRTTPFLGESISELIEAEDQGIEKINQISRRFSLPIMFLEASYSARILSKQARLNTKIDWPLKEACIPFDFSTTVTLMVGSCIAEKIANDISHDGLRDGSLIIICTEIIIQFLSSTVKFWRSFIDGGTIQFYHVVFVTITLILSSTTATSLNAAFDNIHLTYFDTPETKSSKYIQHRSRLIIPLKWLPQGSLPLLFSGFLMEKLIYTIKSFAPSKALSNPTTLYIASALFVGVTVGLLQISGFLGYNAKNMQKHMNNTKIKASGVRPGFDTLKNLNKKIRKSSYKGGLSLGITASTTILLDLWLFWETNLRFSMSSMLLIASFISRVSRQLKALSRSPKK